MGIRWWKALPMPSSRQFRLLAMLDRYYLIAHSDSRSSSIQECRMHTKEDFASKSPSLRQCHEWLLASFPGVLVDTDHLASAARAQ